MVPRESILKTEVEWLASIKADLVVIKCCFCCFLLVGSLNNSDIRIKIELKEVVTMFILSSRCFLTVCYNCTRTGLRCCSSCVPSSS